jgi:hypothetical protein
MKYYLCKFLPPRADFLATMTAGESELMKQHGMFLNGLLDKGLVVAHGPVDDPAGGWGLSLYQVSDDQDIKAYAHCALIRQIQNFSADSRTPRSPSGFL